MKYPCYDSPVHIPGISGTFANVIVEIDDATREVLNVTALPLQSSTPEEAQATSVIPESKEE